MSFGRQLKKIRLERGLNQEDIGKMVHMGKSTVSQWENEIHTPNIDIITQIANYLDVPLDYLAGRTNTRTNAPDPALDEEITQIMKELGPDITLQLYDLKGMTEEEKENLKIFLQGLKARRTQKEEK